MKKILIIALVIIVIVGVFIYARESVLVSSLYISQEEKDTKESARLESLFPDIIEDYQISLNNPTNVDVRNECVTIEDKADLKSTGLTGEVCTRVFIAQYVERNSRKAVFIHASKSLKSPELLKLVIERLSKKDTLGSRQIFRIESHEIGWFPESDFDVIITQEGERPKDGGTENMSYTSKATGNNPVTKYFLDKFSPNTI
jgi:hypothetical protein